MTADSTLVLGIDGAPGGWVVAEVEVSAQLPLNLRSLQFVSAFAVSVERLNADVGVIAVDMPIGLSVDGHRPVDQLARKRLGPRRSTFFPTPIRSMLDFDDYAEANAHSKQVSGSGLSKQAWNLLPKIREVDELWTDQFADRLVEAHPETSFAQIAGEPVLSKKATPEGQLERESLLSVLYSSNLQAGLEAMPNKWRVDALDACAIAWTAHRVSTGQAEVLGGDLDPTGRPMQLVI